MGSGVSGGEGGSEGNGRMGVGGGGEGGKGVGRETFGWGVEVG